MRGRNGRGRGARRRRGEGRRRTREAGRGRGHRLSSGGAELGCVAEQLEMQRGKRSKRKRNEPAPPRLRKRDEEVQEKRGSERSCILPASSHYSMRIVELYPLSPSLASLSTPRQDNCDMKTLVLPPLLFPTSLPSPAKSTPSFLSVSPPPSSPPPGPTTDSPAHKPQTSRTSQARSSRRSSRCLCRTRRGLPRRRSGG